MIPDLLGINPLDLSYKFNSCAVLFYHQLLGINEVSSMIWHTDLKYSKCGQFSPKSN